MTISVEIHGGQLRNKGAQKMLRSTAEKIWSEYPTAKIFVDPVCGDRSELERLGLKVFSLSRGWMGGRLFRIKLYLQIILGWFGIGEQFTKMDVLVDISGFAYSDQWGYAPARDTAALCAAYRRRNKKVVFLPQAFGPFDDARLQRHMKSIIEFSDRMWARDVVSYKHLKNLGRKETKISLCPDITIDFAKSHMPEKRSDDIKKIAIIPNIRMKNSKTFKGLSDYMLMLGTFVTNADANYQLEVLIHDDTGEDMMLVTHSDVFNSVKIIEIENAETLKSKIYDYDIIVSSRYHGLVAALSQNIPAISIGWSHKYEQLMRDYCVEQYHVKSREEDILTLVDDLLEENTYSQVVTVLKSKNMEITRNILNMWQQFFEILKK